MNKKGWSVISGAESLTPIINDIILSNPNEAERFRNGERKLIGFFVGQAMRATKGQGNPQEIRQILDKLFG